MQLRILQEKEDPTQSLFASEEAKQVLDIYKEYYPQIGFQPPWVSYLIIEEDTALGTCGFTGAPKNGRVELAYWTFEKNEGKGVASFACQQLVEIALNAEKNIELIAKTAPEKNASTRILEKNGFVMSEVVQDDEIGDAWLWIHQKG